MFALLFLLDLRNLVTSFLIVNKLVSLILNFPKMKIETYLVGVLVGGRRWVEFVFHDAHTAEEGADGRAEPAGGRSSSWLLQESGLALAGAAIFGGVVADGVCVARCGPVAEVGTVPAASDSARHPRLFDGFADHDAVLFELLGQDGVQERITARIERQDEDGEDFGLFQRHELHSEGSRQREEGDGCPAQEIGEDEQSHPLGDARIVRVPGLRAANSAVHLSPMAKKICKWSR